MSSSVTTPTRVSGDEFKAAMASFAAGVTIITTTDGAGQPFGLTATAFSSVSKEPPLCLVCVSHAADAYPALHAAGRFAVNILAHAQKDLSARFATHGIDKFAGVAWAPGRATGCPLLDGALASVECVVSTTVAAGEHDVIVGAIQSIRVADGAPLVYFRGHYRELVAR